MGAAAATAPFLSIIIFFVPPRRNSQHAYALQLLYDKLQPGGHILDVGSGSGYLTACFARAVTRKCASDASTVAAACVVGIEHQPELVKLGIENVRSDDPLLLENNKIIFIGKLCEISFLNYLHICLCRVEGDGRLGYPEKAPYDAIHVGAAAPKVPEEVIFYAINVTPFLNMLFLCILAVIEAIEKRWPNDLSSWTGIR